MTRSGIERMTSRSRGERSTTLPPRVCAGLYYEQGLFVMARARHKVLDYSLFKMHFLLGVKMVMYYGSAKCNGDEFLLHCLLGGDSLYTNTPYCTG